MRAGLSCGGFERWLMGCGELTDKSEKPTVRGRANLNVERYSWKVLQLQMRINEKCTEVRSSVWHRDQLVFLGVLVFFRAQCWGCFFGVF